MGSHPGDTATSPGPPELADGVKGSRLQAREGPLAADAGGLACKALRLPEAAGPASCAAGLPWTLRPPSARPATAGRIFPGPVTWCGSVLRWGRAGYQEEPGGKGSCKQRRAHGGQAPSLHRSFHARSLAQCCTGPAATPLSKREATPAGRRRLSPTAALGSPSSLLLRAESAPGLRREDVPIHSGVQPTRCNTAVQRASGQHSSLILPETLSGGGSSTHFTDKETES